ncbi:DNA topoisomerase 2-alpha [Frankliniella fusca]|uniref:DNA topoisomerase 2-alpha n=1 Tax=Frankliniella fusca TaxID=407009 RepID=A0AAE1LRL5_9NEOP|nr:DNA topoisomerase 2-alpha [Frankliniella fusca]
MDAQQQADSDRLALFYQYFDPNEMLQGMEGVAPAAPSVPPSTMPPSTPAAAAVGERKKRGRPRLNAATPPKAKRRKREAAAAMLPPEPAAARPPPTASPAATAATAVPCDGAKEGMRSRRASPQPVGRAGPDLPETLLSLSHPLPSPGALPPPGRPPSPGAAGRRA